MSLEFNCVLFIDLMNYLSLHQSFTKVLAAFVKGNARGCGNSLHTRNN